MSIAVSIVEDDIHYNHALKRIVDFDDELICLGCHFSGREALKKVVGCAPDVVLMDIKLPDVTGVELVSQLKPILPKTNFIICTSFENDENVFNSLKSGASGYLLKGESMDKIIQAIKDCYAGGAPMSNQIAQKVLQSFRNHGNSGKRMPELSQTEEVILKLLAEGLRYKEIAAQKYISIDTVKKHAANIYKKLHVSNKVQAINRFNCLL